jgi:hypothetical protein
MQVGGDAWYCAGPRLRLGTGLKLGLYGNSGDQTTNIAFTGAGAPTNLNENAELNEIAFLLEFNLEGIYQLNECIRLRAGYNILVVDGVALAAENFVPTHLNVIQRRQPMLILNGSAFFHGLSLGVECDW